MTEQLVSFLVAKLAKEKGFSTPCSHYYFEDGEFRKNSIQDTVGMNYGSDIEFELEEFYENWNDKFLTNKKNNRCFGCSKDRGYFETFSAPTQSLLAKWLREKHNIHINIWYNFLTDKWRIDCLHQFKNNEEYSNFDNEYLSYEEAFEEGLYECLKLIEL